MEYDLKIAGGTLIDGTGQARSRGDLGIRDGRIVAVGEAPGDAAQTFDATDRMVAPGFIDLHTHYDAQVLWDRMLTISPWHGVTTVVMGNCGFGVAPTRAEHRDLILRTLEKVEGMGLETLRAGLGSDWPFETFPEYLDAVEARGSLINTAAFLGHTPLRMYVMGEESTERPASAEETKQMRAILKEALEAGALGFATSKSPTHMGYSGRPVPSRLAEWDELREVAAALGDTGTGVLQATVGQGLFFKELGQLSAENDCNVTWTALLGSMMGKNAHRGILEKTLEQQARGERVIPQVSCRPLNFEFDFKEPFPLESMKAMQAVAAGDFAEKCRIYADPDFRRALQEQMDSPRSIVQSIWGRTVVAWCPKQPERENQCVLDLAAARGVEPIDYVLDLALEGDLEPRFRMAIFNYDEEEVAELLNSEGTVLGLSDAGAHASQLCDACFSTHLLGHWVREQKIMDLERAIWMLSARPAEVMGIRDRGRLEVGLAADVVVFDPDQVGTSSLRRVSDLPAAGDRLIADAAGIDAVWVNGTEIRRAGTDVLDPDGALPGRLLRGGVARVA